jgi:hypothetical protein
MKIESLRAVNINVVVLRDVTPCIFCSLHYDALSIASNNMINDELEIIGK